MSGNKWVSINAHGLMRALHPAKTIDRTSQGMMVVVDSRGGDDNLGVYQFLVKIGVCAFLVGGGNQGVTVVFEPFPDSELIFRCSQELWDFFGVFTALSQHNCSVRSNRMEI